jgi:hypothetical protein
MRGVVTGLGSKWACDQPQQRQQAVRPAAAGRAGRRPRLLGPKTTLYLRRLCALFRNYLIMEILCMGSSAFA